ncbi:unnamed protein product [Albugo candida]|uniref:Uncharacterized protein n=1 Tax=Albugo candida TaxID=65357 RepID=A0A024GME8_9STRA|nr:unnamed protein product [Albugo candida]|eukprot:CCI48061.1 unnamed protein product [Albugo candida]
MNKRNHHVCEGFPPEHASVAKRFWFLCAKLNCCLFPTFQMDMPNLLNIVAQATSVHQDTLPSDIAINSDGNFEAQHKYVAKDDPFPSHILYTHGNDEKMEVEQVGTFYTHLHMEVEYSLPNGYIHHATSITLLLLPKTCVIHFWLLAE